MKLRIIAVALTLVALALVLVACGKDKIAKKEYFTEPNGDVYVTNANGDHIPVTTDKEGNTESYEFLITKTAERVNQDKATVVLGSPDQAENTDYYAVIDLR